MTNYELVEQWASTLNTGDALDEITKLRLKYPWLKCDESFLLIEKLHKDLKKITSIIKIQEKQNAMHRKFVEVNQLADEAIINAIKARYDL